MRPALITLIAAVALLFAGSWGEAAPLSLGSDGVLFQFGDNYGGDGYGGGGASSATPENMRISVFFTAIPILSGKMIDDPSSEDWTKYWDTGLGGGLHFAYQFIPAFRVGFGTGYHTFLGKEVDAGFWTVKFENMQCIPVRLDAVICFPFNLPSAAWFKGPNGFAAGPAPYVGIELCGAYRPGVKYSLNGTMSTENYFEDSFAFYFGIKAGFEFRLPGFALFLDFGFRYYTAPEKNSSLSDNIKEMITIPINVGIAFYFGGKGGGGGGGYR